MRIVRRLRNALRHKHVRRSPRPKTALLLNRTRDRRQAANRMAVAVVASRMGGTKKGTKLGR